MKYTLKLVLISLLLFLTLAKVTFTGEQNKILTIQVATYSVERLAAALKTARFIEGKNYKNVRIEHIDNFYTLRVGNYKNLDEAKKQCKDLKKLFPKSFVRNAYYAKERLIYPLSPEEHEQKQRIAKKTEQDVAMAQESAHEITKMAEKTEEIAMGSSTAGAERC